MIKHRSLIKSFSSMIFFFLFTIFRMEGQELIDKKLGFDGFEDCQDFSNASLLKPHFSFSQALSINVTVTNQKSNGGDYSLKVKAGKKAIFVRKVDGCKIKNYSVKNSK